MIRLWLAIVAAFLGNLVLAPIGILAWPFRRDGAIGFAVARVWAKAILGAAGVQITLEQLAPLPEGPVVFVSNHVSALDIPILFLALPRPFRIVYKSSLFYVPLLGLFLVAGRHVPIDRSRAFSARRSLGAAARRIRNGVSVALFPEGTRSGDESMGSFKRGSFKLAMEAGAPVVPVSLLGLKDVVRRGRITPGQVRVKIHEALEIEEGADPLEAIATRAEAVIRDEVDRT
ncbi:MAG: 1-acyl-sn-glycerol-3-phosphate acyltransferase [Vicinamibacteria bacterium]|nr:1-acyl-sn-glycerol-3-phosphate acyltransferase [Vicinamibacteria bacterium]